MVVEKELRRRLLELDEHSGHLAHQTEVLTHHSTAMHTLSLGTCSLVTAVECVPLLSFVTEGVYTIKRATQHSKSKC